MSAKVFEGGCLCGATRFSVSGEAKNPCYCHCRSCRLGSGAPFVAWVTFPADRFQVLRGELLQYRSSEKVTRGFCATCGTSITYDNETLPGEIDVGLATLDEPASLRPKCHVWTSHQLPWVVLNDELPRHPEWREGAA